MTFHAAQFDGEAVAWPLLRPLDEGCDGLNRGFLVVGVYRITLGMRADRRVGVRVWVWFKTWTLYPQAAFLKGKACHQKRLSPRHVITEHHCGCGPVGVVSTTVTAAA